VLFFSEMWERFSYYGMRALLVLYLVNALEFPRARALEVYAIYTGLIYLTPLLGGYIADRWLGARRAVLVGGLVMAVGHFAMAVPALLYLAMGLLIAGNGFFKPNISTLVGSLYGAGDTRRDGGFTVFYIGINLGAFLAPLVCGTLGEKVGWHYGFAAAGVGMLFGLAVFHAGQHKVGGVRLTRRDWAVALLIAAIVCAVVYAIVSLWPVVATAWAALALSARLGIGLGMIVLAAALSRLWRTRCSGERARLTRVEVDRLIVVFILAVFVVFFWMGFEQAGGTMNLFADQRTDRWIAGWEMPASYFQAANPLFILLLGPLFAAAWLRLDRSRFAPSGVVKQGIGMIVLGLGFVVLASADAHAGAVGRVSPLWLLAVYLLNTMGELCLSPIGLSLVTKLAPIQLASLMMGVWFTAMGLANYFAGTLEALLAGTDIPLYWFLVGSSIGAGLVLLLISPLLNRWMHGIK
jgi:POT family proton-dependent oligopeptide transporter